MKKLSIFSIAFGVLLLLYGLQMDTTVYSGKFGDVHNIGRMNDRISILITGGFIFLGGIGLFALWYSKRSKEEAEADRIETEESIQKAKTSLSPAFGFISTVFSPSRWNPLPAFKNTAVALRIIVGIISGFALTLYPSIEWEHFGTYSTLCYVVMLIIALRNIPAVVAIYQTLILTGIVSFIVALATNNNPYDSHLGFASGVSTVFFAVGIPLLYKAKHAPENS